MNRDEVYLKPDTLIEPLVNQWYAWPYLLSPAAASMFVANAHVKLMQSFAASPQVHASALKSAAMRGGPFLDIDPSRAPEVKRLLERTVKEQAALIELADGIKTLERILSEEARGFSMEALYHKVPEPLKGYVELVYDLKDSPSIRFIEALLYTSRYYRKSSQALCFSLTQPDKRSFALSTPRLENPTDLFLNIPFDSEVLDELYRMRRSPAPFGRIREALGVRGPDEELFRSFFTSTPPRPHAAYTGGGLRIRYLGHACVLIESPGVNILFDPVICHDFDGANNRFTHADVPETIDYVVLTHNHQDHVMLETLLELRHRIKTMLIPRSAGGSLLDPSLKLILQNIGFKNVREMDEMESIPIEGGSITCLPFLGEQADLDIRTKMAPAVKINGKSVLMMADSNNIEPKLYDRIHAVFGGADVVLIGMECEGAPMSWLYGPLFTRPLVRKNDQSRRLDGSDCEKAMKIVDLFNPRQVYVYAMGQEPWLGHVMSVHYTDESRAIVESNKLVAQCRDRGITSERLYLQKEIHL
jgi:L-ascorbate metabolism protein UlaG (beta-lactamase superfamily)